MENEILSAGIDIGTSTTQLIFSKLKLANTGGFGSVPKVEVVDKEILYRSKIHFTPLANEEQIDAKRVQVIILDEYKKAGYIPAQIGTGAVIITGETARKRNAKEVLSKLSEIAGDFVVASAGPVLESVLSGKGAGAAELSKNSAGIVANLDIGGGTTNYSFFKNGEVIATDCINIGGRLVKVADGRITYVSPTIKELMCENGIEINVGEKLNPCTLEKINRLCKVMTNVMVSHCYIDDEGIKPDIVTFSGGVAACINNISCLGDFEFCDIGVLLAKAIINSEDFAQFKIGSAIETVGATVVGAGNYSMEISGSTIFNQNGKFPKKNLPVYSFQLENVEDIQSLPKNLDLLKMRQEESRMETSKDDNTFLSQKKYVITFCGTGCQSFSNIESIADAIVASFSDEIKKDNTPIIIVKNDISKVLGQAIRRRVGQDIELLCLDSICCQEGDFVDIGEPVANNQVIPVIVKSLIFEK